ncbi:hypothetical protein HGRIS_000212 [Hohenbuehelia grisea]|uniref:WW domain-containing protein n=1 Tax=Hohenbuehelia grisea TaxID=104357 RepID=A0ABR3JQJ3_9AGAR
MDDHEELDWGNDDDEAQSSARPLPHAEPVQDNSTSNIASQHAHSPPATPGQDDDEDAEDAVSLGGDEEEDSHPYLAFHQPQEAAVVEDDARMSTARLGVASSVEVDGHSADHQKASRQRQDTDSPPARPPSGRRTRRGSSAQSLKVPTPQASPQRPIVHALPPKPIAASLAAYIHHSDPSLTEATAMSQRREREQREKNKSANIQASSVKTTQTSPIDSPLPPDWEIRHPRKGGEPYYYNVRTHESQWKRPVAGASALTYVPDLMTGEGHDREREPRSSVTSRSTHPQSSAMPLVYERPSDPIQLLPGPLTASAPQALSFEDRHYRPTGDPDVPSNSNGRGRAPALRVSQVTEDSRYEPEHPRTRRTARSRSVSPVASHAHPRDRELGSHYQDQSALQRGDSRGDSWIAPDSRDHDHRSKYLPAPVQEGPSETQRSAYRTDAERSATRTPQAGSTKRARNDTYPLPREHEPIEHMHTSVASTLSASQMPLLSHLLPLLLFSCTSYTYHPCRRAARASFAGTAMAKAAVIR